jgi:hypothetical protein
MPNFFFPGYNEHFFGIIRFVKTDFETVVTRKTIFFVCAKVFGNFDLGFGGIHRNTTNLQSLATATRIND